MGCGASKSDTGSPVAAAPSALTDGHDSAGPVVKPSRAVSLKGKAPTTSEFAFEPKALPVEEEDMAAILIAAAAAGTTAMLLRRRSSSALSSTAKLVQVPTFCPSPYKTYGPKPAEKDQSLLLRIGGNAAVDLACTMLYDKLYADSRIAHWFDGISRQAQARKLSGFVKFAMGGYVPWDGKDLAGAHEHLVHRGLNDKDFDAVLENFGAVLTELKVPGPILAEAATLVESTRDAVLGRTGKPTMETNFKATPESTAAIAAERAQPVEPLDKMRLKSVTRANKEASRLAQPSADAAVNSAQAAKALDEAEAALRTSMNDLAWTHGPNHVETAKVTEALADVLTKKGQREEAAELQASAVAVREAATVDALDSMRKLAALYASLGRADALNAVSERIRTVSASA